MHVQNAYKQRAKPKTVGCQPAGCETVSLPSHRFVHNKLAFMAHVVIINGPNLNLVGTREPEIYGTVSLAKYFQELAAQFPDVRLETLQSNHEGQLIDWVQQHGFSATGIILNGGALTHTSLALADALASITSPVIEVHISNIHAREAFRQHSYTAANARGVITGLGLNGYRLALMHLLEMQK